MPAERLRLTAKVLAALKPGELARDSAVPGFFAEAGVAGISLKIQVDYRPGARGSEARPRRTIKRTLGRWPAVSLDAARAEALRLLAEAKAGRDPRGASAVGATPWTVARAFDAYVSDMAKRPGTELSRRDMRARLARYLEDWSDVPLRDLSTAMIETRQANVAAGIRARAATRRATGARTANAVVRDLGAVWDFAAGYTPLPAVNPTRRVTMIGEVRAHHEVPIAYLAEWWAAVGALRNPLRVAMHRLGLLSGLRPGNLTAIELAWIHDDRISFPAAAMKGRRSFVLPLSEPMRVEVQRARAAGRALYSDAAWLFPTRDVDGKVRHTVVTREKSEDLLNRTGHALRHTWKTCARNARIPESTIDILLAHRLGGVRDVYGSLADQFDMLLEAQTVVSGWILARATAAPTTTPR